MNFLRRLESLLLVVGVLLLGIYVGARIHAVLGSRAELQGFKEKISAVAPTSSLPLARHEFKPDFSLWSSKRIEEFRHAIGEYSESPIGILRIPKLHLEAPVVSGTDDLSLNIGLGHIAGTVRPGEVGNIGIAGHRDGFFRVLKDISEGDAVELQSLNRTDTYVVNRIVIVSPKDVSILQPQPRPSLTLVTCYPFYFIGSAPQRYIVQASLNNSKTTLSGASQQSKPESTYREAAESTR